MPRLVVNPNTPETWEIELKPGPNRVGRSEQNDFSINHPSISTYHCEFVVSDAGVMVKDLNSIRGTFVNGELVVKETFLQPGQHVQLGSVDMVFDATPEEDTSLIPAVQTETMMQVPVLPPDIPALDEMPPPDVPVTPPTLFGVGANFCKIHPKTPARFFCSKCQSYFCAPCVVAHAAGACGEGIPSESSGTKAPLVCPPFFSRLPGALAYPLRGASLLMLVAGTLVFAGLAILQGTILTPLLQALALCYVFSYLQEILLCTAADRNEIPELPGLVVFLRGGLCFIGTALISFGPATALVVARQFDVAIPQWMLFTVFGAGCLYFPMAFLLASLKGVAGALNVSAVLGGVFKAPLAYLLTAAILVAAFVAAQPALGFGANTQNAEATPESLPVILRAFGWRVLWSFVTMYLLALNMRVLGLFYAAKGRSFGWFRRATSPVP